MSFEFPEPKTEEEAQRTKAFLERGAEVGVKDVQQFRADGGGRSTLATPATLKIGGSIDQILRAATGGDRKVLLTIDVGELRAAEPVGAAVFVAKPDASARTPTDDPSFAGMLGFFFHSADHVGPSDSGDADQLRFELDVTELLKKTQRPSDSLTVTVVALPIGKTQAATAGVTLRSLVARVVRSRVKRA